MPNDKFAHTDSVTSPSRDCFTIVANDTVDLLQVPKALYVGTGGDIALRLADGDSDIIFRNVLGGTILAVRPTAIRATGTSASDLVGMA